MKYMKYKLIGIYVLILLILLIFYQKSGSIPNQIHFIFIKPQDKEIKFSFIYYIAIYSAWKINNPDKIYFYYNYDMKGKWFDKLKEIPNIIFEKIEVPTHIGKKPLKKVAHKADIIRMQKLYERGGIYMDIDTISVKPYKHLLKNKVVLGKEGRYEICNAIMMTEKNSEFFKIWMDNYEEHFNSDGWGEASILLPHSLYKKHPNKVTLMEEDVFFLPSWTEVDKIFKNDYDIPKNLITLHLWESQSMKYIKNINDFSWGDKNKHTLYGKLLNNINK